MLQPRRRMWSRSKALSRCRAGKLAAGRAARPACDLQPDDDRGVLGHSTRRTIFPPAAKANIEQPVVNLKVAFHACIEQLEWMNAPTRKEALRKLDTYAIKVGYPDQPRDYSNVVVRDNDLIGNVTSAAAAMALEARAKQLGALYSAFERAARPAHPWRTDDGREHRRSRWTHARARCLLRIAARPACACARRLQRRATRLPRLGASVTWQVARRCDPSSADQRF